MRDSPTPFGRKCREFRSRFHLRMGDQAKALGISVPYVSAIEIGKRAIPEDYPAAVAEWMSLTVSETRALAALALLGKGTVKLSPKNENQASLAQELSGSLGGLTNEGVELVRAALQDAKAGRYSDREIRRRASLVLAVLGNKELLYAVENYISTIDPDFSLQVVPDGTLGESLQIYSDGNRERIHRFLCTEWFYKAAEQSTPDARYMLAHEIGHWILHGRSEGEALTFRQSGRGRIRSKRNFQAELEADAFARELLMPLALVETCNSEVKLARAANVPLHIARRRLTDVNRLSEIERVQIRGADLQIEESVRKTKSAVALPTPDPAKQKHDLGGKVVLFPSAFDVARERRRARKQEPPQNLPLFEYAEKNKQSVRQQQKSRQDDWFSEFGWRG